MIVSGSNVCTMMSMIQKKYCIHRIFSDSWLVDGIINFWHRFSFTHGFFLPDLMSSLTSVSQSVLSHTLCFLGHSYKGGNEAIHSPYSTNTATWSMRLKPFLSIKVYLIRRCRNTFLLPWIYGKQQNYGCIYNTESANIVVMSAWTVYEMVKP